MMKSFTLLWFSSIYFSKKVTISSGWSHRQKHDCVVNFLAYWLKNLLFRVPGQGRLAMSRLRVPNLDGFVATAAGNLFSIGTPRHRVDTEIVRSQDTNQQQQKGENLGEKNLEKTKRTSLSARYRRLAEITFSNLPNLYLCSSMPIQKKATFSRGRSHWSSDRQRIRFLAYWFETYHSEWPVTVETQM